MFTNRFPWLLFALSRSVKGWEITYPLQRKMLMSSLVEMASEGSAALFWPTVSDLAFHRVTQIWVQDNSTDFWVGYKDHTKLRSWVKSHSYVLCYILDWSISLYILYSELLGWFFLPLSEIPVAAFFPFSLTLYRPFVTIFRMAVLSSSVYRSVFELVTNKSSVRRIAVVRNL